MNFYIGPFRRLDRRRIQLEVDEELQFHVDLLTEEHYRQSIPPERAQATALRQFGNIEQIRDECVRIARRNHPLVWTLKWFFGFIFVAGVLVRIYSGEYHVTRIGTLLMEVGALCRLLLYLRGRTPSRYLMTSDDPEPLKLNDSELVLVGYDQSGRTPVERIISSS